MASITERTADQSHEQGRIDRILHTPMSRRRFLLQASGAVLSLAMIAEGCSTPPGASGNIRPTESAGSSMSPGATIPIESSPLPHIDTLTGDTFTRAFSNLDDTTEINIPNASGTITKTGKDLASYASEVWNDNITTLTASRNSLHAFELATSSADMTSKDGTIDMSQIFPEMSLKLSRFSLAALPNGKDIETTTNVFPQNLVLRKGMNMIVVGVDDSTKEAIIAFEDTLRKQDNIPTMYLSALPLEVQGETDGQVSLNDLLARNGASYDDRGHSIIYETGEILPLNSLDATLSRNLHQAAGSYFLDLDPLKTNKDGTKAYEQYPTIATLPSQFASDKIVQLKDGRIGVEDANGNLVARARYSPGQNSWEWATDKESLQDFTIREYADAKGITIGNFIYYPKASNPDFMSAEESVGNMLMIASELEMSRVFGNFTAADWEKVISNWKSITTSLQNGVLPEGFNYNWTDSDNMVNLAKKEGMTIRAQALLDAEIPDSIYNSNLSNSDLTKILEFMVKTRVLKYKGQIAEWEGASEISANLLYGSGQGTFLLNKLGTGIVDQVFVWARQTDPSAKLTFTDDHILEPNDDPNLTSKYLGFLRHFKQAGIPVDKASIEDNFWIYAPPNKQDMINVLTQIKNMGYQIGAPETTVVTGDVWPIDPTRAKAVTVADKNQAQAKIYRDVAEAYYQVFGNKAPFGVGGFTDAYEWYEDIGHPEANAMIFDTNFQPKPAYFALLNELKAHT